MSTVVKTQPVPLQFWANTNEPDEKLIFSRGYWDQIMLIRDKIATLFVTGDYIKFVNEHVTVIGTHTSKSVKLPVYRITLDDGTKITMRYNFYNWKVSVDSPHPVAADFMDIFNGTEAHLPVYCEGFAAEDVYGPYVENNKQFTIQIYEDLQLYTFFYIYTRRVLGVTFR